MGRRGERRARKEKKEGRRVHLSVVIATELLLPPSRCYQGGTRCGLLLFVCCCLPVLWQGGPRERPSTSQAKNRSGGNPSQNFFRSRPSPPRSHLHSGADEEAAASSSSTTFVLLSLSAHRRLEQRSTSIGRTTKKEGRGLRASSTPLSTSAIC